MDAPPPPPPPPPQPILRARTTRAYPTLAQRGVLRNWFGGLRFIYIAYVAFYKHTAAIKKKEEKENVEKSKGAAFSMGITPLYQRFGSSTSSLVRENPWLLSLPSKVRESAVADFVLALRENWAKVRKGHAAGHNFSFDMKFSSARDRSAAFTLSKKSWGNKRVAACTGTCWGPA